MHSINAQSTVLSIQALTSAQLLAELLALHKAGLEPEREFIEANAFELERLWNKGLSNYQILRMDSGRVRFKSAHPGVLTAQGLKRARAD